MTDRREYNCTVIVQYCSTLYDVERFRLHFWSRLGKKTLYPRPTLNRGFSHRCRTELEVELIKTLEP